MTTGLSLTYNLMKGDAESIRLAAECIGTRAQSTAIDIIGGTVFDYFMDVLEGKAELPEGWTIDNDLGMPRVWDANDDLIAVCFNPTSREFEFREALITKEHLLELANAYEGWWLERRNG